MLVKQHLSVQLTLIGCIFRPWAMKTKQLVSVSRYSRFAYWACFTLYIQSFLPDVRFTCGTFNHARCLNLG